MTASHPILSRLDTGRPLLVGGDPAASLRARGVTLHAPAALGRLLREDPAAVREHYHQEISSGVDVLGCLTGDTIPRALHLIGMMFRAAALTGTAVDLALDAVELTPRPLLVAGVLGNTDVPSVTEERLSDELGAHAARLAAAGCELILARGFGPMTHGVPDNLIRLSRRAAILSAVTTELPTWAVIPFGEGELTPDGEHAAEAARHAVDQGAQLVLFEVPSAEVALAYLERRRDGHARIGFALAAGGLEPEAWAAEARRLLDRGVRVLGGGLGTTHRHLAALSGAVWVNERQSSLWPRAV